MKTSASPTTPKSSGVSRRASTTVAASTSPLPIRKERPCQARPPVASRARLPPSTSSLSGAMTAASATSLVCTGADLALDPTAQEEVEHVLPQALPEADAPADVHGQEGQRDSKP